MAAGTVTIKRTSDDATIETIDVTSGQVTGGGTDTITVNPATTFANESYYILISAAAFEDAIGNDHAGIATAGAWSFTAAQIGACAALTIPNQAYYLSGDIASVSGDCFTVTASGITVEGQNHTVSGPGAGAAAFNAEGYDIAVNDLAIEDFEIAATTDRSGDGGGGLITFDAVDASASNLSANAGTGQNHAGGSITLTDSAVGAIVGHGSVTSTGVGGNGSAVTLIRSITGNIDVSGGSCTTTDWAGHGGVVTVISSTTGTITANGGDNTHRAGNGTQMIISDDSTVGTLSCVTGAGGSSGTSCADPTVSTLSPADDATGVSVTANLVLTFDEAVRTMTGGTIIIYKSSDDSTFESITLPSSKVTGYNTTAITINPAGSFEGNTQYYVQVSTAAFRDTMRAEYAGLLDTTSWSFTTGASGTVTGTPDLAAASDLGASSTDNTTSDNTPTFDITCTAGATVQLRESTTTLASGTCAGGGTISLTSSTLSDAAHTITAREDSGGGYGADSSGLSVTIDTSAPAATGTPDLLTADDSGASSTDDITSDTTPRFTVSCAGTNTVTLKANGSSVGTGTCSSSTVTITASALSETAHTMTATQTDTAGNESTASSSLSVTIDATVPTVTDVTSSTTNATIGSGSTVSIQVTFSSAVLVTGTPRLTLETGSSDAVIDYVSGTTTSSLTFTYVVRRGDSSSDLDYVATNSLALNGGTILDAAGNVATLTLPSPAASGSLGANKALVIDGVAPVLSTATVNGNTLALAYDSTLDSASTPATTAFTVTANGTPISVSSVSISSATVTLTLASAVPLSSTVVVSYALTATRIQDEQGNDADVLSSQAVTNDSAAPALSTASVNGATLTLTYAESLDATSTPATTDFVVIVGGVPVDVSSVSVSGTTVTLILTTAATVSQTVTIDYVVPGSGMIKDSVGNEAGALTAQSVTNATAAASSSSSSSEELQTPSGGRRGNGRGGTATSDSTGAAPNHFAAPVSSNPARSPAPNASPLPPDFSVSPFAPAESPAQETFRSFPITTGEMSVQVDDAFYTDVPLQSWYADAVYDITGKGIVHGDTDLQGNLRRLFRPEDPAMIAEMSRMLLSAKSLTPKRLTPDNWERSWMRLAQEYDLPFSSRPARAPLTRAEAVVMILEALGQLPDTDSTPQIFSDVPSRHPYAPAINQATALGYIFGDANARRRFRPNDMITRAEAAILMERVTDAH